MSRPSLASEEMYETILDQLIEGKSLRLICGAEGMPNRSTVLRWLDVDEAFAAKYARAREMQADYMDDLILETAEACRSDTAAADRVKIDAYKWRASKLKPKAYGERITHAGDETAPIAVTSITRKIVDPKA